MKSKYWLLIMIISLSLISAADAQVYIGGRFGGGFGYGSGMGRVRYGNRVYGRRQSKKKNNEPAFKPVVYASLGYGFPNLDASQLPDNAYITGYNKGITSTSGPITGAIDYRFSRNTSIGVMTTYGKVSAPYTNSSNVNVGIGSIETWGVLVNMMNYAPLSNTATLYFRLAFGANITNSTSFSDQSAGTLLISPSSFAYQVGIGARFDIAKNTALFAEAGYGKYILHGGISFAFR